MAAAVLTEADGLDAINGLSTSTDANKAELKTDKTTEDDTTNGDDEKEADDQDSSDGEEPEEKVLVGMECDKKDLFQKWDSRNKFTWTDTMPEDLEEAAENEATEKFAILVRNAKSYDSRKKLEVDSIVIQSPLIKNVLHTVLKNYPGVTTTLHRLTFSAPFRPFVHRWSEMTTALEDKDGQYDAETRLHFRLLYDLLYAELKDVIEAVADYQKTHVITYEHAWTIFHPGCVVLGSHYGSPVANQLVQGQYMAHPRFGPCFEITCKRVEYNGKKFGYNVNTQYIMPYPGTIPIESLPIFPLEYHSQSELTRAKLIARGRKFEELSGGSEVDGKGYQFRSYQGIAIEPTDNGPTPINIEGRIVLDVEAASRFNLMANDTLEPLTKVDVVRSAQAEDPDDDFDDDSNSIQDYYSEDRASEMFFRGIAAGNASAGDKAREAIALTEDQLLLTTPMICGFGLRNKKFLEFFVDSVADVSFNEHAFGRLVLPSGHKQLILAFAQSQVKNKHRFDDVIAGKGKGIIMLLHGGPGIGKTLTAESVAETMRVPLYVVSAGELGVNSYEIETRLGETLAMVAKWNAVLLIDECDVFLETRTSASMDRNRTVSIFLRTLEYYEGILFLTTNRIDDIDDAFHSRIHITLSYPDLDQDARRNVWTGFLGDNGQVGPGAEGVGPSSSNGEAATAAKKAAANHAVQAAELDILSKLALNGRQIKNLIKTSHLLAYQLGEPLSYVHLKQVLEIEGYKIEE